MSISENHQSRDHYQEALRQRARDRILKQGLKIDAMDQTSARRLLEELHIHQIELEIQNEELRDAQAVLQQSRDEYAALFNHAPVGYVVVDGSGIVQRYNHTFETMVGEGALHRKSPAFADLLDEGGAQTFRARYRAWFRHPENKEMQCRLKANGGTLRHVQIHAGYQNGNNLSETKTAPEDSPDTLLLIIADITELKTALEDVKKLSGLLPICSHCKKIRDDQGYWKQIEAFIMEHSEARFSHGICRECAEKYYPDLDIYED